MQCGPHLIIFIFQIYIVLLYNMLQKCFMFDEIKLTYHSPYYTLSLIQYELNKPLLLFYSLR